MVENILPVSLAVYSFLEISSFVSELIKMNFRRQPFQFTSIDPVKRHAELQKRFGLPADEMYVDYVNPGVMGAGAKESMMNGSPRLQHRVPVFPQDNATKSTIHNNVDNGQQPRVRVIPIQVEGLNDASKRHRTFSGPAAAGGFNKEKHPEHSDKLQPTLLNSSRLSKPPRVCNIPIKIETKNNSDNESKCKETIIPTVVEPEPKCPKEPECQSTANDSATKPLKQIEDVLNKLKGYDVQVQEFTGTNKDKKYRYLDEMLTRCMLDLDNVDTLGLDNVRQSRKNAVKKVQACIDLLETKVSSPATVVDTNDPVPDVESESAMVVEIEMKDNDALEDAEVLKKDSNSTEDNIAPSEITQACDIEMEDGSCGEQSAAVVVEELGENLTEVGSPVVKEDIPSNNNGLETSVTIEEVNDCANEESSEFVVEEMCSDSEKLPVKVNVPSDVCVVTEQDMSEQPELIDTACNEQVLNCTDETDLGNINTKEQIRVESSSKTDCDIIEH